MVAGLIQSENVAAVALKNSDKQADDSGLESGHTSMNNCKLFNITDIWLGKGSKIKFIIFAEFSAKGYPLPPSTLHGK